MRGMTAVLGSRKITLLRVSLPAAEILPQRPQDGFNEVAKFDDGLKFGHIEPLP